MVERHPTAWFALRGVVAIALMVGFYLLALTVAGALLWIPFAEWRYLDRIDLRVLVVCVGGGIATLLSIVPRKDHFTPPGPTLDADDHPALFSVLRDIAATTGQRMPSEVYLLNDVNAFVAERGGRMGVGGVRVMGVGLPLIQALTVDELRAVMAHEFGHYWSGDVKLGPWIHKTHAAIAQTVGNLGDGPLAKLFIGYNLIFLRLTMAISRRQEFVADEVAARVTSPRTASEALKRVAIAAPAFSWYLQKEVLPALRSGFMPPVAIGFDAFLQAKRVNDALSGLLTRVEPDGGRSFDTHPTLDQRLAALAELNMRMPSETGNTPASALLTDPETLAVSLLIFANGHEVIGKLRPIGWHEVGESVFAEGWREMRQRFSSGLAAFAVDSLPVGLAATVEAGHQLARSIDADVAENDHAYALATQVLAGALGACLLSRGWTSQLVPGESLLVIRDAHVINPYEVVTGLSDGTVEPAAWKRRCAEIGLTGCSLSPAEGGLPASLATV